MNFIRILSQFFPRFRSVTLISFTRENGNKIDSLLCLDHWEYLWHLISRRCGKSSPETQPPATTTRTTTSRLSRNFQNVWKVQWSFLQGKNLILGAKIQIRQYLPKTNLILQGNCQRWTQHSGRVYQCQKFRGCHSKLEQVDQGKVLHQGDRWLLLESLPKVSIKLKKKILLKIFQKIFFEFSDPISKESPRTWDRLPSSSLTSFQFPSKSLWARNASWSQLPGVPTSFEQEITNWWLNFNCESQ